MPGRPPLKLIPPSATPEEAAAIVAAIERFMRASALASAHARAESESGDAPRDRWRRAALLESVEREPDLASASPWINT